MKKTIPLFLFSLLGLGVQAQYSGNLKVEELLASETNGIGQKLEYPNSKDAEVVIRKITFPPSATTGWHKHGIPVFSYILKGTLNVEFENHETMVYSAGESFAESRDTYHRGINDTKEDLEVLVVYLGGDNRPLSMEKPDK